MDAHEDAKKELLAAVPQQQQHGGDMDTRAVQIRDAESEDSPYDVFLSETKRLFQSILASEAAKEGKPDTHAIADQQHDKDDTDNEDDDGTTVTLPSNLKIEHLGRQVRFKHLTVLLNNINFSATASEIIRIFKEFGCLRNIHMPCYRANQPESHRGFALLTFVTAHEVSAAMRGCRARLDEAGHGGVRVRRLADYHKYDKYCEGLDVGAIMTSRSQTDTSQVEKQNIVAAAELRSPVKKRKRRIPSIQRTSGYYAKHRRMAREDILPEENVRSHHWRKFRGPHNSHNRKKKIRKAVKIY